MNWVLVLLRCQSENPRIVTILPSENPPLLRFRNIAMIKLLFWAKKSVKMLLKNREIKASQYFLFLKNRETGSEYWILALPILWYQNQSIGRAKSNTLHDPGEFHELETWKIPNTFIVLQINLNRSNVKSLREPRLTSDSLWHLANQQLINWHVLADGILVLCPINESLTLVLICSLMF
jgi:hypothetical protein